VPQVKWTRAQSNKLLLEAVSRIYTQPYEQNYTSAVGPLDLPRLESTTNRLTGAAGYTIPTYTSATQDYSMMASASYVTGSHAIKAGLTMAGAPTREALGHAHIHSASSYRHGAAIVARTPHADERVNGHARRSFASWCPQPPSGRP